MTLGFSLGWRHYFDFVIPRKSEGELALEKYLKETKKVGHTLTKLQASEFRKKFIQDNFEETYRDDFALFHKHQSMSVEAFMKEVCSYKEKLSNSRFNIKHNPFREGNFIYGIPVKKCNAVLKKIV